MVIHPVAIVGAGPGDPGLMTVRGMQCLAWADVVVHDALVSPEIMALVRVERIDVGKRHGLHKADQAYINAVLIRLAQQGRRVVRLKGGDPLVFGRGAEEMLALRHVGLRYELVPGISSAFAAPAMLGIPVTHREHAASVTVVTGHECEVLARDDLQWRAMAQSGHTLVILMGLTHLESIVARLLEDRPTSTPVAVIQEASTPRERSVRATLATILAAVADGKIVAPAIVVVGNVVALGDHLAWR